MISYKIQIPMYLFHDLELKGATFYKKDIAIETLKSALNKKGYIFKTENEGDDLLFINSSGGELARIKKHFR